MLSLKAFEGKRRLSCCCHAAAVKGGAVYPIPRLSPRYSAGALFVAILCLCAVSRSTACGMENDTAERAPVRGVQSH
jgi:hypothetical protein